MALTLALAVIVAGRGTARLLTFLGLYWMVGGLITLRFALAIRPRRKPGWLLPPAWQRSWARFSCCYAICWMISYTLTC